MSFGAAVDLENSEQGRPSLLAIFTSTLSYSFSGPVFLPL